MRRCRAVSERPASCRENFIGRAKETERAKERDQQAHNAELEETQRHVETIEENEREQRLIREQEQSAGQACSNSPERCERAEAEADAKIKSIERER